MWYQGRGYLQDWDPGDKASEMKGLMEGFTESLATNNTVAVEKQTQASVESVSPTSHALV